MISSDNDTISRRLKIREYIIDSGATSSSWDRTRQFLMGRKQSGDRKNLIYVHDWYYRDDEGDDGVDPWLRRVCQSHDIGKLLRDIVVDIIGRRIILSVCMDKWRATKKNVKLQDMSPKISCLWGHWQKYIAFGSCLIISMTRKDRMNKGSLSWCYQIQKCCCQQICEKVTLFSIRMWNFIKRT